MTAPGIAPEHSLRCAACALVETAVRDRIVARDVYQSVRFGQLAGTWYVVGGPLSHQPMTRAKAESLALLKAADELAVALCPTCAAESVADAARYLGGAR